MKHTQATQVKLCADCTHRDNVRICWKCRNGDMKRSTSDVCKYCGHQPTKLEAAAPALLAALEEARSEIIELADGLGCDHDANICKCSTRELVHRLDSALTLATGKEG